MIDCVDENGNERLLCSSCFSYFDKMGVIIESENVITSRCCENCEESDLTSVCGKDNRV